MVLSQPNDSHFQFERLLIRTRSLDPELVVKPIQMLLLSQCSSPARGVSSTAIEFDGTLQE